MLNTKQSIYKFKTFFYYILSYKNLFSLIIYKVIAIAISVYLKLKYNRKF